MSGATRGATPDRPQERIALVVIAAVGIAVHGWFILAARGLNSDQALVLLMARSFAQGEPSVFFWAQNYMASLEQLLMTPLAAVGAATPLAAGLVAFVLTTCLALLSLRVTRRLGGARWLALLVWAVPPAVVVHHHVALYGARLAATLLVFGAFAWGAEAESRRAWVGIGVLAGVAYFGDHLMLPWAAGVAWLAVSRARLAPLALGALPIVALDATVAVLTPAFHLSGPNDPGSWLGNVGLLTTTVLPQLFGLLPGRGPAPVFQQGATVLPAVWPWLLFAVPGAVVLAALAWTGVRRGRPALRAFLGEGDPVLPGLVLVCLLQMGLFLVVGGGGDRWSVRYLVPLWPALSVLAGVGVAAWRPRRRLLALLVVLPSLYTLTLDGGWPPRGPQEGVEDEVRAVAEAVHDAGVAAVWANYWDAYRMALLVDGDTRWAPLTIIERRSDWRAVAQEARPVGYLLRPGDTRVVDALAGAETTHGVATLSTQEAGSLRLVVTEATVPGLIDMNDAPPRGRQVAAALAAALLFAGMLAIAGLVGRIMPARGRA